MSEDGEQQQQSQYPYGEIPSEGEEEIVSLSDLDQEDFVMSEAEKDAAKRRAKAKRPAGVVLTDYVAKRPDLAEYFAGYPVNQLEQIKICRAYASYLATMQPVRDRAPYKKSKK